LLVVAVAVEHIMVVVAAQEVLFMVHQYL